MTGIMQVMHYVFDWSFSPTGRAEVESLSEVIRADLAKVDQLYSSVSLPAVVQTLTTQEVRELKGSAFQAALDAAEFVLSHGLPETRPSFVYTPAGPTSNAAAVCGAQLARHLLSSALEIANGLTRQHKVLFAETLLRLSVDTICR